MRGIILAGGTGSRLRPATLVVSKQLLPVFDKPMIYYPLATLLSAGVRDVLVITTPRDQKQFKALLGDGSQFGASIAYALQRSPRGVPDALSLGRRFAKRERVALILGDNIFVGRSVHTALKRASAADGAHAFAYRVPNPEQYGVVDFRADGRVQSLKEKPARSKSNWAIPGVYVFPPDAGARAAALTPSKRGELEIIDLLRSYLADDELTVHRLSRDTKWFDAGTPESLLAASTFVANTQRRTGRSVGSPAFAAP